MTITYEIIETDKNSFVKRNNTDGSATWIPLDSNNADFQQYQKSLNDKE